MHGVIRFCYVQCGPGASKTSAPVGRTGTVSPPPQAGGCSSGQAAASHSQHGSCRVSGSRQTVVVARRRARQPPRRRGLPVRSPCAGCAGAVWWRVGAAEARDPD
eukprot:COSAG06_NODE_392_length_16344_cov_4.086981_7_plen_105_part_00